MSTGSWARAGAEATAGRPHARSATTRARSLARAACGETIGYLTFRIAGGTQRPAATSGLGA